MPPPIDGVCLLWGGQPQAKCAPSLGVKCEERKNVGNFAGGERRGGTGGAVAAGGAPLGLLASSELHPVQMGESNIYLGESQPFPAS